MSNVNRQTIDVISLTFVACLPVGKSHLSQIRKTIVDLAPVTGILKKLAPVETGAVTKTNCL
ncbi:MAG: hypothetical protein BGP14_14720 [Sphingobacteriales bacterium 44-15]|nr:MAG: hypothetical protein BGP14_14720 [Sphingobacteriales bacterium 44-15]